MKMLRATVALPTFLILFDSSFFIAASSLYSSSWIETKLLFYFQYTNYYFTYVYCFTKFTTRLLSNVVTQWMHRKYNKHIWKIITNNGLCELWMYFIHFVQSLGVIISKQIFVNVLLLCVLLYWYHKLNWMNQIKLYSYATLFNMRRRLSLAYALLSSLLVFYVYLFMEKISNS